MPFRRRSGLAANTFYALIALAIGALLLWHGAIPDGFGVMGLVESVLPWFGILIALFGVVAIVRRSSFLGIGALVAAIVWAGVFVPHLVPHRAQGSAALTVISQNVDAGNGDPARTVAALAGQHPDIIALQELTSSSREIAQRALADDYPHHVVVGTIGVWSTLPLSNSKSLSLGLGWKRALRVDVASPLGTVRLYELHAASLRPGEFATRDAMLANLGTALRTDDAPRLIALGDFNAASTDRAFTRLLSTVHEPDTTGWGLGFTWPAQFPGARVDHVVERGFTVVTSEVLPRDGSDHRAVEVGLKK